MEHSLLHAAQLLGIVATIGGSVLVLLLLNPAYRALGADSDRDCLRDALGASAARWASRGALVGAVAGLADLFIQTAELKGQTIYGGVDLAVTLRFAFTTTVGQLVLVRAGTLLVAALVVRWSNPRKWWFVAVFGVGAVACACLVSHAAAQPTMRLQAIALQAGHIGAAAVWMGGLVQLLAARAHLEGATTPPCTALVAGIVRRFSPVALVAAATLLVSGGLTLWRLSVTPGALLVSAYGLTLSLKLVLLVPLLVAGWRNFRTVRPALLGLSRPVAAPDSLRRASRPVLRQFGRLLELEVTTGVLVIAVAGILGSISPPGDDGSLQLTSAQLAAVLSPDLPTTAITDPAPRVDLPMRTVDDFRYAEFTHNWSGVFVCLMGLCWLFMSLGGRVGAVAGRLLPFVLIPFALFIAVAADPRLWMLRALTWREALSTPSILEHQLGAFMVLGLAWLARRDQQRPAAHRPLGYPLPVVMILGSLLLLGHAHSTLTVTEDLTNLINVQHAVLGALGLLAGTVRWLGLRGLLPPRLARVVWPSLVVALGLFMAFVYREVV